MNFWSKKNIEEINSLIEYKYILLEPLAYNSFFDFMVLFRWFWGVIVGATCLVFLYTNWAVALTVFVVLMLFWWIFYKSVFKKYEEVINKAKKDFKDISQTLFGH